MQEFRAPVTSGAIVESVAGPAPDQPQYVLCSDVFPTGNTLIHRSVIEPTGLFDLAYDCATHEDGDLGMRIYLTGALMILKPAIQILHHHAPTGGLRTHGQNLHTQEKSRASLVIRDLPT